MSCADEAKENEKMEKLRVGVIGTGGIGRGHAERLSRFISSAVVTAVNDINEETASATAAVCGAEFLRDPHELILSEKVDAILVASWDRTHEEFVRAAIKAGKPVFCEKPLSDTADGCRRIIEDETAYGRRLLTVGFMRRYDRGYQQMREIIASGKLGEVLMVHAQHRNAAPTGEKHTTVMSVSGALVHEFDITRFLLDDEYVSAQMMFPRTTRHADPDLIDPQIVCLKTRKGALIDLEIFMNCRYGYDIQCEVVGEDGTVRLPELANIAPVRFGGNRQAQIYKEWYRRFEDAYVYELRDWVDSALEGRAAGASAWDGYVTSAVAEKCTEARLTGKIIEFDLGDRPALYR